MRLLTPNVKIKSLRKKYKITQQELAGEAISRSHIAMMESGKNNVSEKMADILVGRFNFILREKGNSDVIDTQEILEGLDEQRKKLMNKAMDQFEKNSTFEEGIRMIEKSLSSLTPVEKGPLFKKIADKLRFEKNYERSNVYYNRALNELLINEKFEQVGDVAKWISRLYIIMADDSRFLDLENSIRYHFDKFREDDKKIIFYNFGTLLSNSFKIERAIPYFEKVKSMLKDKNGFDYFDVENELALCYIDSGEFDKAEKIYRSLQRRFNDNGSKVGIFGNMIYLKTMMVPRDTEGMKYYMHKCRKIFEEDPDYEYLDRKAFFYECAELYVGLAAVELGRNKFAIEALSRILNEKTNKSLERKINAVSTLLVISSKKELELIHRVEDYYFELIERCSTKNYMIRLTSEFNDYYLRYKLYDEIKRFNKRVKEYIEMPKLYI